MISFLNINFIKSLLNISLFILLVFSIPEIYAYDKVVLDNFIKNKVCDKCDLESAQLKGLDLTGAVISNSNLNKANLMGANLTGADLKNTSFKQTFFENAIWVNGEICKKGSFGKCINETIENLNLSKNL